VHARLCLAFALAAVVVIAREPSPSAKAKTAKPPPAWKQCPAHRHFGCEMRSQGMAPAPGERIPEVCGCIPRCPRRRPILIAQETDGTWPDGSLKGTFTCAESGLP
jgi:hypothetical protein